MRVAGRGDGHATHVSTSIHFYLLSLPLTHIHLTHSSLHGSSHHTRNRLSSFFVSTRLFLIIIRVRRDSAFSHSLQYHPHTFISKACPLFLHSHVFTISLLPAMLSNNPIHSNYTHNLTHTSFLIPPDKLCRLYKHRERERERETHDKRIKYIFSCLELFE